MFSPSRRYLNWIVKRGRTVTGGLALTTVFVGFIAVLALFNGDRNAYQLPNTPYFSNGYEWWWHSFVARSRADGSLRPFFIEYFVINPGLGQSDVVPGGGGRRPSYAKLMAGTWGEHKAVLEALFPVSAFTASREIMDVHLGSNWATDTELHGEINGRADDTGPPQHMAWNLRAEKVLHYDVGFLGGRLFQWLGAFDMQWHVRGMQTRYAGTVTWNDTVYDVEPDSSYGYQDKNWGRDYTAPWYWLSCNDFVSKITGRVVPLTSLDGGGGTPRIYGWAVGKDKLLIALRYEGALWEWNFTHLLNLPEQSLVVREENDRGFR